MVKVVGGGRGGLRWSGGWRWLRWSEVVEVVELDQRWSRWSEVVEVVVCGLHVGKKTVTCPFFLHFHK